MSEQICEYADAIKEWMVGVSDTVYQIILDDPGLVIIFIVATLVFLYGFLFHHFNFEDVAKRIGDTKDNLVRRIGEVKAKILGEEGNDGQNGGKAGIPKQK